MAIDSYLLGTAENFFMSSVISGLLVHNAYGKSDVRVTKVIRKPTHHELKELIVDIQLEGDFSDAYTAGSNKLVVATDSMKNTVYVMAADHPLDSIESFARQLAQHFLDKYEQVSQATVQIRETRWSRLIVKGKEHPWSFSGAGDEKRTTIVVAHADEISVESGIEGLVVVKTGESEFSDFVRDKYTTLADTHDRIFGTSIEATWVYNTDAVDFEKNFNQIRDLILEVFATHKSLGVQHTLHEMGQRVLDACHDVDEITLTMPNQHRIPFNLQPFGLENKNEIFMPINEPYGLISGTLRRS